MKITNSSVIQSPCCCKCPDDKTDIEDQLNKDKVDKDVHHNLGYKIMYQEWMQKIMLSDGVDEDENRDW